MVLARDLRSAALKAIVGASGRSLRSQMRQAGAFNARYALILGAEELASNTITVRDLGTATQERVSPEEVVRRLKG
jgi:histidyl-tRNA synthetase